MRQRCWWFGINNAKKPRHNSHIAYSQIEPLLSGIQEEFEWPYHKQAKRHYVQMRPSDKVLFWMGDGKDYTDWGVLGFGFIGDIRGDDLNSRRYVLRVDYVPPNPITPYPSGQPQETEETHFLKDVFGLDFKPLGKTFANLGYDTTRPIITIDEVSLEQFEAIYNQAKSSLNLSVENEEANFVPERHIYRLSKIPTESQYIEVLRSLFSQNRLNDLQLAILSAQYWAPDHTAGAAELGKAVGHHWIVVNGQYGRLGHLIADEIGFRPDQREIGTYRWWAVLAEGWNDSENRFIWRMHKEVAEALEELGWMQREAEHISEEVTVPDNLIEGAVRQITVNSYERNPTARKKCIEHYGTTCYICGFDFEAMYGPLGKDYTHVHHLKPLSEINETYQVDPANDLRPVCPNCHAIIHRKNPPLTIEQVKNLLATYGHK